MSKKILVPLDGSKLAEVALPYAEELATKLGYEVALLNVRSPAEDPYHPVLRSYLESMSEKTKRNVQVCLIEDKCEPGRVESVVVGSGVLVGHPAEGIIRYADRDDVELIVMATHGRTGVRRWALGSIADKVVRASDRPVMLVRAHVEVSRRVRITSILVPLDGSKQSETVLPYVTDLASQLNAEVILLHVIVQPYHIYAGTEGIVDVPYTEEELQQKKADALSYLEKVRRTLTSKGINASSQVETGSAADEILRLAEELNVKMVAMSTHGHSGFTRWEHGSVANKVLHAGNTPLLLMKEPARKEKESKKTATGPETIESLIGDLASSNSVLRVKARTSLVTIGKQAVRPVAQALKSREHWVRWEAAKTLAQIGDPTAAQALINALEDDEFDVRWLAAEGLIHIGADAVEPLLIALVERPDSLWLREGAHHVLHDLLDANLKQSVRPVLAALEDLEPSLEVASAAEAALDKIRQRAVTS